MYKSSDVRAMLGTVVLDEGDTDTWAENMSLAKLPFGHIWAKQNTIILKSKMNFFIILF